MGFKLMNGVHEAWINEVMETNTCTKERIFGRPFAIIFWSSFVVRNLASSRR